MADVKFTGQALIDDIQNTTVEEGVLAFWWMGQGSFIYKGSRVLYFDPYLTPSSGRQTPPVLKYEEVTNADLVLCTHDHLDHIDPDTLPPVMKASPDATLVVPRVHVRRVVDLGIPEERVVGMDHMETLEFDGVHITALKSKHESFDEDPELGFPFLGFVVETNGFSFYHSGDTIPYEGLVSSVQGMMPNAVFLPINGRDAERFCRNCLGNMTFQEAVDIAGEVKPTWAIPHHWDMFKGNQEDPQKFVDYLKAKFPDIQTWVGAAGERVVLRIE